MPCKCTAVVSRFAIVCVSAVSLFFRALGWRACRFHPSCSKYATQAFKDKPLPRAFFLTVKRILRCQPFSAGGYDPLPEST